MVCKSPINVTVPLRVIPVVRYSVERRIAGGKADYWDWATLLEIEVLGRKWTGPRQSRTS